MSADHLQSWQEAAGRVLTTRLDKHTGRRILIPTLAALNASLTAACRQPRPEISLVGDAPAGPPPEPRFDLENDPSLQSPEAIIVRLIQSTFRPRYQGIFAIDSTAVGAGIVAQHMQRVGINPNFSPTPRNVREYNHYLTHPTYVGDIRGGEFSKDRPLPDVITYANYNISFEPDNTWSRFDIRGGSSLDRIPEIGSSARKLIKPNGDVLYEMSAEKLAQAADLLVVLPRNAQRTFMPRTPGITGLSDRWTIRGDFNPESASVNVKFDIYKDRGFWSLVLTRPNHTPIPQ